ncbi:MAG: restriction endonuclease subunit S [Halobacteriota archaeon]
MNKHRNLLINAGQIKSGYKPAAIGSIPTDWEVVKFEDAILRQRIKVGKIKQQEYKKVGKCPVIDQSQSYIAGYTDEADKQYQGTFPVIIFGDHTRVFKFVDFPFVVGADGVKVILPDKSGFDPKFFYYALLSLKIKSRGYNRHYPLLKEKEIPLPPLSEQQKIATVLSTIQRAVEHQDKIIETTRKLKKSLMHKLFTEGLNGEEQTETEIGLIPESWDVMRLGDVCKKPQYGLTASATQIDTGSKFLRISDIQNQKVYWNGVPCCECSEEEIKKYKLEKSDIVIARIGATTGKSYLLDESTPLSVFGSYLIRIKTKEELKPDYLYQFFNSERYWEQINKNKGGRLKGGVNSSVLVNLKIPFPPLSEQQQIAHILSTVDKKIEIEKRRKTTFKELFKTMLHKLMSGEMRLKEVEI